jgi:hypothetical protein
LASVAVDTPDQPLTETDRAAWRTHARDWLTGDLAAWQKLADSTPDAHSQIAQTLAHWQSDPDLAPVRDAKPILSLPESERVAWRALWADVRRLLAEVHGETPPNQ